MNIKIKKTKEIEPVRELLAPVLGRNTFVKTEIKFKDK